MTKADKKTNGSKKKHWALKITEAQWDLLVEAYREMHPPTIGAHAVAAESANMHYRTASAAWRKGVSYLYKEPIKDLILREQVAARAAMVTTEKAHAMERAEQVYAEAENARAQVIEARTQEGEMVKGLRSTVMNMVELIGKAVNSSMAQMEALATALETGIDPTTNALISPKDRVDIIWKISRMVRQTGESAMDVIRAERLLLGEPTDILGFRDMDNVTEEEAIIELRQGAEMADRMEKRREMRFRLIQGGAPEEALEEDPEEKTG